MTTIFIYSILYYKNSKNALFIATNITPDDTIIVILHENPGMRAILLPLILFVLAQSLPASLKAQDEPFDDISKAIRESDARSLAAFFSATIEISLPDAENTYSASQGEMVMKDFFNRIPADNLTLVQKGSLNTSSHYSISTYHSGGKNYQLYMEIRKEKEKFRLFKIKLEEKIK